MTEIGARDERMPLRCHRAASHSRPMNFSPLQHDRRPYCALTLKPLQQNTAAACFEVNDGLSIAEAVDKAMPITASMKQSLARSRLSQAMPSHESDTLTFLRLCRKICEASFLPAFYY